MVAKQRDTQPEPGLEPRSARGKRMRGVTTITPRQEIPVHQGCAAAYYLRPDGATISEALVIYPNGNDQDKRFAKNYAHYRQPQRDRGLIYLGPTVTAGSVGRRG